jgi:hypothetical protein
VRMVRYIASRSSVVRPRAPCGIVATRVDTWCGFLLPP